MHNNDDQNNLVSSENVLNGNEQNTSHVEQPLAVALFSGGLDSILAARLVAEQGVRVECLHFVSPFFGKPEKIKHWSKVYGLSIEAVDISDEYVDMMARWPEHGFGSVLNPCVDCKITMVKKAREIAETRGACCIISGEVLGQRPMSQRRDTLNIIARDSLVKGMLLRPLCARHMEPTDAEKKGLIDREKLLGFSGRGRSGQFELAQRMGITEFPNPAGGCLLTEKENARSYWPVFKYVAVPQGGDFYLANTGRQYWSVSEEYGPLWLTVGRNQADNDRLQSLARESDIIFKVKSFPGPLALGRFLGREWSDKALAGAAAFVASFSPKAVRGFEESKEPVLVRVHAGHLDNSGREVAVKPEREASPGWGQADWTQAAEEIRAIAKSRREGPGTGAE